jgi:hypothetical protein
MELQTSWGVRETGKSEKLMGEARKPHGGGREVREPH